MKTIIAVCALALSSAAAGCGSSPPAHSASVACADFRAWGNKTLQGTNPTAQGGPALLSQAINSAPSGKLSRDLARLASDVRAYEKAGGVNRGSVFPIINDDDQVRTDCYLLKHSP